MQTNLAPIHVFSEIGKLEQVLVHTPGQEIDHINPNQLDDLLFSAYLQPHQARIEHQNFCKLLSEQGVKVVHLKDLFLATWKQVNDDVKKATILEFIKQIPQLDQNLIEPLQVYLQSLKPQQMVQKMMAGIFSSDLVLNQPGDPFIAPPMPNLYFTRDPWAAIGNGISLNAMKYPVRKRENFFSDFIFNHHKDYRKTTRYFDYHNDLGILEGGDIFVYNQTTLVIGKSERTTLEAIQALAQNLIKNQTNFTTIVIINVPAMPNLMHLDTWLTMVDYNKFLYSPNMLATLESWTIDLTKSEANLVQNPQQSLQALLKTIIKVDPILIPVGGKDANQLTIDIETHFDATNFLVIKPGVVIGYDRNQATIKALKQAGVKVIAFNGDQLSLGMGSARCMSMPLIRKNLPNKGVK